MGLFSSLFKKPQKNATKINVLFDETKKPVSNKRYITEGLPPFKYTEEQIAVLFLNWCNKTKSQIQNNNKYPQWFTYELHISPSNYHKRMVEEGFLKPCTPSVALEKLNVAELKKILQTNGLEAKGKKTVLIDAILSSVNINSLNLPTYYEVSKNGMELLSKPESKELIIAKNNRYGITFQEYYHVRNQYTDHVKPNDVMWRILNEKQLLDTNNCNYGLLRNTYLNQAYFLEDEKRFLPALEHFIYTAYFDLSGCGNNNLIIEKDQAKIAPALIVHIQKYSEFYTDKIIERCSRIYLPHHYYNLNEFEVIIRSIIDETDYYTQFIL